MKKIRRCPVCSSYTMEETHCNKITVSGHPTLFNPNDPYGRYRRKEKGLED